MRISKKLPIAAAVLTVLTISTSNIASLVISSDVVSQQSFQTLEAITDGRRDQLQIYLRGIREEIGELASDKRVKRAFKSINLGWGNVKTDQQSELQQRYITNNPNPEGEKELLDTAENDGYDSSHKQYHPEFREFTNSNGFQDMYLINNEGDVIYSVKKQSDFAVNLTSAEWSETGLAKVWNQSISAVETDNQFFEDYSSYKNDNNKSAAFIAQPILNFGNVSGTIVFQMPNAGIAAIMNKTTGLGETGETLLLRSDGFFISDSQKTETMDSLTERLNIGDELLSQSNSRISTGYIDNYLGKEYSIALTQIPFLDTQWVIATLIDTDEVRTGITNLRNMVLIIATVMLGIAMIAAIVFSRTITRPISNVVNDMNRLISGDTNLDIKANSRNDEIGDMFKAVSVFRDAAIEKEKIEHEIEAQRASAEQDRIASETSKAEDAAMIRSAVDQLAQGLSKLSQGDLTVQLNDPFAGDLDRLRMDFNASVANLSRTMSQISQTASTIKINSSEMSNATSELAHRTETQAASLEETSAALDQITATVRGTSERAKEAAHKASEAQSDSEESSSVVSDAIVAMNGIEAASADINNIINVIDEIAFQTNLLALNAGVEAARAGEAGKGFAVVAQEVRELAQRSAKAAKEIKDLISASGQQVESGVKLVRKTGESLTKITEHVHLINEQINTISQGAAEQLSGIQEVNSAVNSMDQVTQQNAAMVEENTAVTHQVSDEVISLAKLLGTFKLNVDPSIGEKAA